MSSNPYKRPRREEDYGGVGRSRVDPSFGHRADDRRREAHYRGDGDRAGPSTGPRRGGAFQHKPAGGDSSRMIDSRENAPLLSQKMSHGTEGVPIALVSNFYPIHHQKLLVYHYDTAIAKVTHQTADLTSEGDQPKKGEDQLSEAKKLSQERYIKKFADTILAQCLAVFPEIFSNVPYVYDGWKNLYTTRRFNFEGQLTVQVKVHIEGRLCAFSVRLSLVASVSLDEAVAYYSGQTKVPISERVISVFETIFKFVIGKSYGSYQRKFFDLENAQRTPKVKLVDFVQGFINAVRMTEFGLALNVHLKTSVIISKHYTYLLSLVCEILQMSTTQLERGLERRHLSAVNRLLRHLKIFTSHSKRTVTYTIDGLVEKLPRTSYFEHQGRRISLYEYFESVYGLTLMALPMVRVSGPKNIHLPLELCYLVQSQYLNKSKYDPTLNRELLFKSTHTPNVYFEKVSGIVRRIQAGDGGILKQFGIQLQSQAASIQGRVLPTPANRNAANRDRFYEVAQSPVWGVFCFDTAFAKKELVTFSQQMMSTGRSFGLHLKEPLFTDVVRIATHEDLKVVFENVVKKTKVKLLFIGIPTRHDLLSGSEIYGTVKQCCDLVHGIMSQCFKADILRSSVRGYFDNFLLKVNGKLGGLNSALEPSTMEGLPFHPRETMLIGVDVNHPGEGELALSSVAAAVGSYDAQFSKYSASIRVQAKERDEMVKQLDAMIGELLGVYRQANGGAFPRNLVVFRDGVSEGQFEKVTQTEIPLIRRACAQTMQEAVKLVLIVVQKRHHTRFVLKQLDTSGRKATFNVPSGTVVDRAIVEPYLKGTSKPTKYIVLQDDLNLSADELEKLCYYSCFNSIRTRSVIAIPTPVRYADLCAYRAKLLIEALKAQEETRSSGSGGNNRRQPGDASEGAIIEKLNDLVKIHENIKNRLFYC